MRALGLVVIVLVAVSATVAACDQGGEDVPPGADPTETATTRATQGASPGTEAPTSPSQPLPTSTPTTVETGWTEYSDPVLGFALTYPSDLLLRDLSPSQPIPGSAERVLDFRNPTDSSRGVSISVSANTDDISPAAWALSHTACVEDTLTEELVTGYTAAICTEEATENPNAGVVIAHMGRIYHIGSLLSETEFEVVLASLDL